MTVLDQLEELEREATPAPWSELVEELYGPLEDGEAGYGKCLLGHDYDENAVFRKTEDAQLVALSRTHLRALLDVARAAGHAREALDQWEYEHTDVRRDLAAALAPLLEDA